MSNSFRRWFFAIVLMIIGVRFGDLYGQVPVHQEPRHHNVFENKAVRILNVVLPPGDTSLFHIHQTPSFFIYFTSGSVGSQLLGESAVTGSNVAGRIHFENLAAPNTRTHRVWNLDQDTFHVMDLELLYTHTGFAVAPLVLTGLKLEIDTAWIRAYRLTLEGGKSFVLSNRDQEYILVALDASEIKVGEKGNARQQKLQPGSFLEIDKMESFSLINSSNTALNCILLEFPQQ